MLSNIIEFKDFLNYYQTILNTCSRINENAKVYISHDNDTMYLKIVSDTGISTDTYHCSQKMYCEIIELIYSSFISTNKVILASKKDNKYCVESEKIQIISEIDDELATKISNQVFNKIQGLNNKSKDEEKLSEFEKISDFFRCYSNFLKRCIKKDGVNTITVSYNNGLYAINISNNSKIVFSRCVVCSTIKARYLNKMICENMIDENSIQLSSVTKDNKLKIQTPKFCLLIPYNNLEKYHNEALAKMNEYNVSISMQKVKSSNR